MSILYIQAENEYTEYIVLDGDQPLCYQAEGNATDALHYEDIYLGMIDRIQKGMEAAFVQLQKGVNAYLPFSECVKPPVSGDQVLLQIKRMTTGSKLPYVTEDLSIAGKYVILLPFKDKCAISQRITDASEQSRLRAIASEVKPEGFGIIMRSEAASLDTDTIRQETEDLVARYQRITEKAKSVTAPGKVETCVSISECLLRDRKDISEIYTDHPLNGANLDQHVVDHPFLLKNAKQKVIKSLQHNVWLKSGGYFTCDICEALTVYDINSGKYQPSHSLSKEENIVLLNEEAAKAVAANIQLRRLGGIILIDFLDMQTDAERERIMCVLKAAFANDPVKTVIHGFTKLGLLEMTRKRTEPCLTLKEVNT